MKTNLIKLFCFVLYLSLAVARLGRFSFQATPTVAQIQKSWFKNYPESTIPNSAFGNVLTFSKNAFAVIAGSKLGSTLAGVSFVGQGRVVALGHNKYLSEPAIVAQNIKLWAANAKTLLENEILEITNASPENLSDQEILTGKKLIIWAENFSLKNDGFLNIVDNFIRNGGGLLIAYPGWVWTSSEGIKHKL